MRITKRQLSSIIREAVSRLNENNEGAMMITDLTWDPLDRPGMRKPGMSIHQNAERRMYHTPEAFRSAVQRIVNRHGDVAIERAASEAGAHIKGGSGFWRIVDPGWLAAQEDYLQQIDRYYSAPRRYYGD